MSVVGRAVPSAEAPERSLAFETLLAELSSRFIDLPPAEIDREIEDSLRQGCGLVDLDVAVLWQWSDAIAGVITPTHTYSGPERSAPAEPLPQDPFPWPWCGRRWSRAARFASPPSRRCRPGKPIDMVPNLSPKNLMSVEIGKDGSARTSC